MYIPHFALSEVDEQKIYGRYKLKHIKSGLKDCIEMK